MMSILPCFADPCAEQKYVNDAGSPAEVYGIPPLMHALGCVCLIIAKYFELASVATVPHRWSLQCGQYVGALLLCSAQG